MNAKLPSQLLTSSHQIAASEVEGSERALASSMHVVEFSYFIKWQR